MSPRGERGGPSGFRTLPRSPWARRGVRTLLALSSALLTLLLLEAGWRVHVGRRYGPTTNPRYVEHDERLGWRYRRDADLRHATEDFDVRVHIGPDGFRAPDLPSTGPHAGGRLVALGDSLTFGWGVEERDSFCARLREEGDVEVRNLAVSGYGTDQELLLLGSAGFELEPDAVLVTFCANDVEEVLAAQSYGKSKPHFDLLDGRLELRNVPVRIGFFERHSALYRSLARMRVRGTGGGLDPERTARGRELVRALLRAMQAACAERGLPLLVAAEDAPWLARPFPAGDALAVVDLAPALRSAAATAPTTFAHDPHWTPHGHRAVARAIAAAFRERGWLFHTNGG